MSTNGRKIKNALKDIANDNGKSDNRNLFFTAEVKKVDDETCDVDIVGDTYTGVHLAAVSDGNKNNLIIKPKKGSVVLICDKSGGNMTWMNVIAFSEIANIAGIIDEDIELKIKGDVKVECDNVEINDGNNDGLVIVQKLTDKINKIEDMCNNLLSTLQGVSVTLAPTGAFPFATIFSGITPLVKTKKTDIENDKIKH
jgi:hypothetical protein